MFLVCNIFVQTRHHLLLVSLPLGLQNSINRSRPQRPTNEQILFCHLVAGRESRPTFYWCGCMCTCLEMIGYTTKYSYATKLHKACFTMFINFLSLTLYLKLNSMSGWLNLLGQTGYYIAENILNKQWYTKQQKQHSILPQNAFFTKKLCALLN